MKFVAIVGSGCSGLAAIKACLEEDLVPVCFEKGSDIGGLWNFAEGGIKDHASIYHNLVINTSKEMMAFSDFPTPEEYPPFLPHECVLTYFRLYAEKFQLLKHINFNTSVVNITKTDDYVVTGKWKVTVQSSSGCVEVRIFDGVMVCTGHHSIPYVPKFQGDDVFKGPILHSHDYKDAFAFKGKKVLVVGIGNSAVDIAVDISRVSSQVFLSTRRGAWVIGRTGFWGIPADLMANNRFIFSLPLSLLQWVVEKQANLKIDHETFGLKPEHGALEAHPTINDELPFHLMSGKIVVKPNVTCFHKKGVNFSDNTNEDVDAIILATGYDYRLDFIDQDVTTIKDNKTSLYKYMYPPHLPHPTLAMIGLLQPVGAVMPISEIQSRWFTNVIKGESSLPSVKEMTETVERNAARMNETYVKSRRHTLQTFWIEYMDDIASQFGVKPSFVKLFFEDPVLAFQCVFGPCVPAQYRLHGPGSWKGARPIIMNAVSRATKCPSSRKTPSKKSSTKFCYSSAMFFIYALVFVAILFAWLVDRSSLLSVLEEVPAWPLTQHIDKAV